MTVLQKLTLSDYTEGMRALLERLEQGDDAELLQDTLDSIGELADDKIEAILYHIDELKAVAAIQKEKAKALNDAAAVKLNKAENLKTYIDMHLKATNQTKPKQVGIYKLSYRAGSKITVVDESKLPKKYFIKQDPKPMGKPELKKLVEAGTKIPGVSIVTGEASLQIKM